MVNMCPARSNYMGHNETPTKGKIMNKIELIKTATNIVVGSGVVKISHSIIRNNVRPENVVDQATVIAGSIVLGQMAADASKNYTNAKIDEIASWWNENIKKN